MRITKPDRFINRVIICPAIIGVLLYCGLQAKLNYRKPLEEVMPYDSGQIWECNPSPRRPDVARPALAESGFVVGAGLADSIGAGEGPESLPLKAVSMIDGSAPALPQIVARKALGGAFGSLKDWQEKGYEQVRLCEPIATLAWITHYWPGEFGVNRRTASGRRVSDEVCAMLDLKFGTFILIDLPKGFNLRRVWDRGSRRNAGRARSRGASVWCDIYMPRRTNVTYVRNIYIVP